MIKSGIVKSALLLACIGIIVVALVEPIAGHMIGQGNMTERDMKAACPDNKTHMMHFIMGNNSANGTMMHCMMGERPANETILGEHLTNETMMHCMMGDPANGTMRHCMMHCMMGNYSANDTMMIMRKHSANGTMMHCMMGDHMANETMMHCMMDQNASTAQARLDCADFWLQKAIKLHEIHLKDPSTATNESQMEMMDQMMRAYECIKGENATENMAMGMMNTTAGQAPMGDEQGHQA